MFRKTSTTLLSFSLAVSLLASSVGRAETVLLPDSRHAQFQALGLFIDDQSMLVFRSGGRAWGALGGTLAILEATSLPLSPQLVAHGSANASFRFNDKLDTLLTETVDARAGLALEGTLSSSSRLALGWTHQSGHISDNVADPDLIGPNLGNEQLYLRGLWDLGPQDQPCARVGASLKPYVGAEPAMKAFAADQFAEWFPFGAQSSLESSRHTGRTYLAGGLEEAGRDKIDFTWHLQGGWLAGNHFFPGHTSALRFTAGYYHGMDPRMKYAQFKNSRVEFGYLGIMFDI